MFLQIIKERENTYLIRFIGLCRALIARNEFRVVYSVFVKNNEAQRRLTLVMVLDGTFQNTYEKGYLVTFTFVR